MGGLATTLALAIGALDDREEEGGASVEATAERAGPGKDGATAHVTFHDRSGSLFIDGDYVIRGVPGRILNAMLREHEDSGRTEFSNKELRLNRSLGLPAGKDNLEARLLTLRRRLEARDDPFRLESVGRGRLRLTVDRPVQLSDVDD